MNHPIRAMAAPLGFAIALAAGTVARGEFPSTNDAVLQYFANHRTPSLTGFAIALAELGDSPGVFLITTTIVLALAIARQTRPARLLAFVLIVGSIGNAIFKRLIQDPRPFAFDSPYPASGFSYPSGHAQAAVALYGTLMLLFPKWAVAIPCVLLITGICWCRLYLGVHRPTEVLAGLLVAGLAISLGFAIIQTPCAVAPGSSGSPFGNPPCLRTPAK